MNPPAYLNELLHFANNKSARKEKTLQLMSRKYNLGAYSFTRGNGGTSHAFCAFGVLIHNASYDKDVPRGLESTPENFAKYTTFSDKATYTQSWMTRSGRNGVEILGAEPNAKGTTYSKKCRITVPELKEACKKNGIKTTGMDKKGLLHALMKV